MERPVNPDPGERPEIKSVFRVARVWRWTGAILVRLSLVVALMIAATSKWYFGVAFFVMAYGLLLIVRSFARCPRCGIVWSAEDLDAFVCTGCRLDIGLGLRK